MLIYFIADVIDTMFHNYLFESDQILLTHDYSTRIVRRVSHDQFCAGSD